MPLFTTNKTANYTAAANELVRADCSDGSFTVTLPASPSANDQVGVFLRDTNTGTNSRTVTVAANSGQSIFGEGSQLKLFVEGDYVELQYQGATDGWVIINDCRQAHVAIMSGSNSSGQTFDQGDVTEVNFAAVDFDNAGLASLSNESITIRRAGRYQVNARMGLNGFGAIQFLGRTIAVQRNGSDVSTMRTVTATGSSPYDDTRDLLADVLAFDAGDVLTVRFDVTSNAVASTSVSGRPKFSVAEVR